MSRTTNRVVALTTGLLVAGVAAPAFAATAHAAPTALTIKAAHSSVAPKHKDTLTGTLKSGKRVLAGETVVLEQRAAGAKKWTKVAEKTTNSKGQVVLTVTPGSRKGQKEQYELVFAGTATDKGSHSQVITVTVS